MKNKLLAFSMASILLSGCGADKNVRTAEQSQSQENNKKASDNFAVINNLDDRAVKKVREYRNEKRSALVIGNNDYLSLRKLKNAVNDSSDISKALKKLGFAVREVRNGNREQMLSEIESFSKDLKSGGVGMVFYAGHGLEMGGNNYLIPVDAKIDDELDIKNSGVSLNDLLYRLENSGNRLNIVVLDACRNDPFTNRSLASRVVGSTRGLSTPPTAKGTYIAYSADVGQEASDGSGKNGLFTEHLLTALNSEGIPLNDVFKIVRANVEKDSNRQQSPASYDKTTGEFFFTFPNSKPKILSETDGRTDFYLTVKPFPADSKIEFLDSDLRYRDEVKLSRGKYKIRVSRDGYLDKTVEIELDRDTNLPVTLVSTNNQAVSNSEKLLIWNGINFKYRDVNTSNFDVAIKINLPKDEFETEIEYKARLGLAKSDLLNSYLRDQKIEMTYTAERQEFDIIVSSIFGRIYPVVIVMQVPRSEAKDFKENVKNVNIQLDSNLKAVGAFVNFGGKLYSGTIDEVKQQYIQANTVSVGNLMFGDKDLPKAMNWNSAVSYCENLNLLGLSDWRLPNKDELNTAYSNKSKFKNIASSWYWSISKYNSSSSWVVDFNYGYDGWYDQTNDNVVVCVRDL